MKKEILRRLTNTKVIISIASTIVMILVSVGVKVPNENVMIVVEGICTIGILLGIFNDKGMETENWDDKK
ncbi:hypothetical protein SH1V18_19370 [Vallitalea longa]|uniref:Uncharacterized protein n=1 Tax=Vallitalea longa TaxID=2936439 RepID=A0A9W5Y9N4_9FIRM|nr:hypothetical protein [Vallitalea longa]GKX29457.1 hypothetical protein SH1V18_19370 [Vallitalea longa]